MSPVAAALAVAALGAPSATAEAPRLEQRVSVSRVLLDVRVVDARGRAIPDLRAPDFEVRVDGVEVPVESAAWVAGGPRASGPTASAETPSGEDPGAPAVGRLIVLFFQRDLHPSRLKGLMRMSDVLRHFVDRLRDGDRVALVVHDVHLKLYADLTTNHARVAELLPAAVVERRTPPDATAGEAATLARFIVPADARRAAHAEDGLLLVARALQRLPGAKTLIYIGWGLNRWDGASAVLGQALGLLIHGRVTMYSLDVTDADFHTLEGPLVQAARDTGGFYLKTHVFSELAMTQVERAIVGHYEVSFVKPDRPPGRHAIDVRIRGRRAVAYHRSFYDD